MTKYVKSIKFSTSGETYVIRDAEQKDRLDTLEPAVNALDSGKQDKLTAGANITIENNVISATGGGTGAVNSVNGKTGTVVLEAADVHAATEAQGAKADTAVQPADIADMETQTHASGTYQTKLTSANAGNNVQITEESGVVKISATGGGSGSANWGSIGGTLSDQTDLQNALNAKISTGGLKTINDTSLEGSGNIELLTSSDVGTMAAESKDNYYTKTEADDEFVSSNQGAANAGKFLKVDDNGVVVPASGSSSSDALVAGSVEDIDDALEFTDENGNIAMKVTDTGTLQTVAFDSDKIPDGYERYYPLTFLGYYGSTGSAVTSNANDYLYTEIFVDDLQGELIFINNDPNETYCMFKNASGGIISSWTTSIKSIRVPYNAHSLCLSNYLYGAALDFYIIRPKRKNPIPKGYINYLDFTRPNEIVKEDMYINVDGFKKQKYTLTMNFFDKNGVEKKTITEEFVDTGRSEKQIKDSVNSQVKKYFDEHLEEIL